MKKSIACLLIAMSLGGGAACSKVSTSSEQAMKVSDALTQAQGAAAAIATLIQAGPMSDDTKQQVANWGQWLNLSLGVAGVIAKSTGK